MQLYGHRGASGVLPENTIAAFERAIELGVAGIETDLHATADDQIILTHDPSLARAYGIDRDVRMMTLAEVQEVAPDVPTLRDLLNLAGDRIHLDLEVKQPYLEELILAELARYPATRWAISCFDWRSLKRFRTLSAGIDLWLLTMFDSPLLWQAAEAIDGAAIAIYDKAITVETVANAHASGLEVMVWTVNDPDRAADLADLGVDILCTDHPERFQTL